MSDIIKHQSQLPSTQLSGGGTDAIRPDDIKLPFLKLVQKMTPDEGRFGAADGEIVNTITGESYGNSVYILPIFKAHGRFHRDASRTTVCRANSYERSGVGFACDDICGCHGDCLRCNYSKWSTSDGSDPKYPVGSSKPPSCSIVHNYISFVLSSGEASADGAPRGFVIPDDLPAAVGFTRTSEKQHYIIDTYIKATGSNMWDYVWCISTEKERSKRREEYFVLKIRRVGAAPQELRDRAAAVYASFKNTTLDLTDAESGGDGMEV